MTSLNIKNLSHKINQLSILNNISFNLESDRITCILGPSGCGKTTLLKIIAGLEKTQEGEIYIIPSNVEHSLIATDQRALALDIFSPPRTDYKK